MYQESADILRTDKSIISRAMGVGNIMDVIEDKVVALIGNKLQTVSNYTFNGRRNFRNTLLSSTPEIVNIVIA
jgi:hypothetical protein